MDRRTVQLSFTGGELSPELYGRPDAVQYRTGAAKLRNWIVKPQGPARTRPGFRHVATSSIDSDQAIRLLPFIYSTGQSFVVEIGCRSNDELPWLRDSQNIETGAPWSNGPSTHTYIRFHTQGSPLYAAVPVDVGEASVSVSDTEDAFACVRPHGLLDDEELRFITGEGASNALPTGLTDSLTPYYVYGQGDSFTSKRFQVSATSLGAAVSLSGGAGPLLAYRASEIPPDYTNSPVSSQWVQNAGAYTEGDLVWADPPTGAVSYHPPGIYRCVRDLGLALNIEVAIESGYFIHVPSTGVYEIISPVNYSPEDLASLVWRQNGDSLTIVSTTAKYPLLSLTRISAYLWSAKKLTLGSSLPAPTGVSVTEERGEKLSVYRHYYGGNSLITTFSTNYYRAGVVGGANLTALPLAAGDSVYVENMGAPPSGAIVLRPIAGGSDVPFVDGQYMVTYTERGEFRLGSVDGLSLVVNSQASGINKTETISADVYYSSIDAETSQDYQVTAVDEDGRESAPSTTASSTLNVLSVRGAFNTISWSAVATAVRYKVYKKASGLFGYIGETEDLTFDDKNIAPDLGRTPPISDGTIVGQYPGAIGGYEQRLFLAATQARPQTIWASKAGSELDFSYTLPVQADNRIKLQLDSSQAQTVKHMIALRDLIVLTQSGEWRLRASDDGALTPASVFARQEGFVGASDVQPVALNDAVVYVAHRGGHVRKTFFDSRRAGFAGQDASLRAAHFFDELTVTSLSAAKAPFPLVWATSSDGSLLGLTFIPEEQVEGWHKHTLEGASFLCAASVPEFDSDVLYAAVKRLDQNGNVVYTIERMQETDVTDVAEAACLDGHASTYQATLSHPYSARLRILQQTSLSAGQTVEIQGRNSSDTDFEVVFDSSDVGDEVEFTLNEVRYRARITVYNSASSVNAKLLSAVPSSGTLSFAETQWKFLRKRVYCAPYWAGQQVTVVSDGQVTKLTASASPQIDSAFVDLTEAASNVHVGASYVCDLQTLPVAVQIEGVGAGREKNVDRAWLRVYETSGLYVGPDDASLVPVTNLQTGATLQNGEKRTLISPSWNEDGQILVRQTQPYPASVLSISAQITFGS